MPSTYSPSLKLELIGNGEQAGTWGTTTNLNLGTLLEQAITGVLPITLTGDVTLTDYNGLSDQARNAVLIFNGLLGAPCNVIAPPSQKVYIVRNRSNATVTIKTTSGNGIAIANAASEVVFCDGTDFYSATQFNYIDGNLTVSGTATANNVVATNDITLGRDLFANSSTGQFYLPTGNTATRTSTPVVGLIRYNSEGHFYEGYTNASWVRFTVAPQGSYAISYLIISGGGGAGQGQGGGGGGGGYISNSFTSSPSIVYTITVGAGGAAATSGGASSITGVATGVGGGRGGSGGNPAGAGNLGGSGGGGGGGFGDGTPGAAGGTGSQGNNGGGGGTGGGGDTGGGGGGGGASTAGTGAGTLNGANGGSGQANAITGISVTYAGGGGGGAGGGTSAGSGGSGGSGGGANGGNFGLVGGNGTIYLGGGGGGGAAFNNVGGSGGSGVVILSVPTVNYTGTTTGSPTITTSGAYTILKFTISGSYTT